jgi:protein-disulfide isomerase
MLMPFRIKYHWKIQLILLLVVIIANLILPGNVKANAEITTPKSLETIAADDIVLGSTQAPVIVIEYFSPTCTHCAAVHQKIFPTLKKKYIDTGSITYVMREFVGNKQDLDASILARCSGNKEQYLQFIETILSTQDYWAYGKNYRQELIDIGIKGGISKDQYTKCLADDALADTLMQNTMLAMRATGFIGTPGFFINGNLIASNSEEELVNAIEEKLQGMEMMNKST